MIHSSELKAGTTLLFKSGIQPIIELGSSAARASDPPPKADTMRVHVESLYCADYVAKVEIFASRFFWNNEANSDLKLKLAAAASDVIIQKI